MTRISSSWIVPCIVAGVFGLMAWGATVLGGGERVSAIWFANGLLLGFLLADKQERWRLPLAASAIANCISNPLDQHHSRRLGAQASGR